jgi:AraC-like DNA-binding protein
VAVVLQASSRGLYSTGSSPQIVEQGRLVICDVNRPFEYAWRGRGALVALNIPVDDLGVPTDVIAAAGERASSSPLYGLMCRHVRDLALDAERLSASTVADSVGSTTIELIRALMASTNDYSLDGRQVGEDTLITQVRIYVNQHLGDPDLSPDTVAAGLAISARQLYRVCARVGLGPEQLIIASRLVRARQELAQPRRAVPDHRQHRAAMRIQGSDPFCAAVSRRLLGNCPASGNCAARTNVTTVSGAIGRSRPASHLRIASRFTCG